MSSKTAILGALLACHAAVTSAHLMISSPAVWGGQSDALENPLQPGNENWFCHGQSRETAKGQVEVKAGGSVNFPVLCGAAATNPGDAANICGSDPNSWHNGGGCALSIAYKKDGVKPNDFVMFSSNHDCPTRNFGSVDFKVPANLPACDDCVCSWTWIPQTAGDEMYMNCFNCKVLSDTNGTVTGGTYLKDHYFSVPGYESKGGARPLYKDVLPNGELKIDVATSPTSANLQSNTTTTVATVATSSTVPVATAEATSTPVPTSEIKSAGLVSFSPVAWGLLPVVAISSLLV
ncbi:hypothetical protein SpCBS45565_g05382 [Spizellomyces sp. 'palustris']|nr:hypothetical protein SpCBS45565_g05382 [Spizellomyces sp. 'palustris']